MIISFLFSLLVDHRVRRCNLLSNRLQEKLSLQQFLKTFAFHESWMNLFWLLCHSASQETVTVRKLLESDKCSILRISKKHRWNIFLLSRAPSNFYDSILLCSVVWLWLFDVRLALGDHDSDVEISRLIFLFFSKKIFYKLQTSFENNLGAFSDRGGLARAIQSEKTGGEN